jgi:hypothetical protein
VPSEDVDRSTVAAVRERNLYFNPPCAPAEEFNDYTNQLSVSLVEESVESSAVPSGGDSDVGAKRGETLLDFAQRQVVHAPRLEVNHLPSAHAGPLRDVGLAHPLSNPQRPMGASQVTPVHASIFGQGAYRQLIGAGLPRSPAILRSPCPSSRVSRVPSSLPRRSWICPRSSTRF